MWWGPEGGCDAGASQGRKARCEEKQDRERKEENREVEQKERIQNKKVNRTVIQLYSEMIK